MAKFLLLLTLAAVIMVSIRGFQSIKGHNSVIRAYIKPPMIYSRSDNVQNRRMAGLDPYEGAHDSGNEEEHPLEA